MAVAWRVTKKRHRPYDATGAMLIGGRWNAAGRRVIYASDSFAGALLEILAHSLRPRTLAGLHHAVRIDIPDAVIERLEPSDLPGWDERESLDALRFGERWLEEGRSAVLSVPSVVARPVGRTVIINADHVGTARITVSAAFDVPWDERLF